MHKPIAIVGIGCRMPGGVRSTDDFWQVIRDGKDTITDVPAERWSNEHFYHPDKSIQGRIVSKRGGFIDDVDVFDNTFFRISPKEASSMDPQQRHLLEVVHEAFEDAGILTAEVGEDTGVYVGIGLSDYRFQSTERSLIDAYTLTGSSHSVAANRISYVFDLKGPSCAVDTACASSITAMHFACCGLTQDECKVAVVAGCNNILMPEMSIGFSALGVMSSDGRCCPFSSSAKGYVRSEGCGALILKTLSSALKDGDHVYAVIRSTAIAANGSFRSLTMPSGEAQENVIRKAYSRCEISMTDVQYVEAHGTGTPVGDPIEAEAIGKAFAPSRQSALKIGSVKGNFGHNEYAAGVTASIKVALMLHRRELCANINYIDPNPAIDMKKWKLEVQTKSEPLTTERKAVFGLNSFGFGGAVAHAIFEESPRIVTSISMNDLNASWKFSSDDQGENIIIPLSAHTTKALVSVVDDWKMFKCDKDAQVVVSWLASRRVHHDCRLAVIASSGKEFTEKLIKFSEEDCDDEMLMTGTARSKQPKVCMVFPGQGQQWKDMGRKLYATEDVFKSTVNSCDVIFQKLSGWSLLHRTLLFVDLDLYANDDAPNVDINDTLISQPAILFFQIALYHLWCHWGVTPAVVVGHSLGEVAAAYACGGLSLEEAVQVIYHRSNEQTKLKGNGSMVAVRLSLLAAKELCSSQDNLHVAAVNSPTAITIAGSTGSIENISDFTNHGVSVVKRLRVESAYHTPNMDTIREPFKAAMAGVIKSESRHQDIKLYSTVTGQLYTGNFDTEYWWDNIRNPVDFQTAVEEILQDEQPDVFLECGASVTLLSPIKQIAKKMEKESSVVTIPSGMRKQDARVSVLRALGVLYTVGLDVNWRNITKDCAEWVSMPTYPWQHQPFWVESNTRRNQRLGRDDRTFHSQGGRISVDVFPFLADHVLEGNIVFPGAGYVEYVIETSIPLTKNPCIKLITFKKMLLLSIGVTGNTSNTNQLHLACDKDGPKINITAENTVYSSALLDESIVNSTCKPISLDAILSRCRNKISSDVFYEDLSTVGLQYGPTFQVVEEAFLGDGEIVGFLRPTPANKQRLQITHLDGCFQLLLTATRSHLSLFAPVAIECIRMHVASVPSGEYLVAHATITDYEMQMLKGDIVLATRDGKVLVDLKGCQCAAIGIKRAKCHPDQWLYTTKYQGINSGLPSTQVVAEIFSEEKLLKSTLEDVDVVMRAGSAFPVLKTILSSYVLDALNTVPQHERDLSRQRYLGRLEKIAQDESIPTIPPEDIIATALNLKAGNPDLRTEIRLVEKFGKSLPETLRGQSSAKLSEYGFLDYISESKIMQLFCKAGSEAIVNAILEASKRQHVVRVLEIGSRNGVFTKDVAGHLQDLGQQGRLEYTCLESDLSVSSHPRLNLEMFPFLKFKQFDIEKDPEAFGLVHDSTDFIICVDVLQKVVDLERKISKLRNLLCQDGWLLIVGITGMHCVAEVMLGTQVGNTSQDTCWLSHSDLVIMMRNQGFQDVRAVSIPKEFWCSIIVGRKTQSVEQKHKILQTLSPVSKPKWILISENEITGLKENLLSNNLDAMTYTPFKFHEVIPDNDTPKTADKKVVYVWDKSDVNANMLVRFLQDVLSTEVGVYTRVFIILRGSGVEVAAAGGVISTVSNKSRTPIVSIHLEDTTEESTDALLGLLTTSSETPDRELLITSGKVCAPRVLRLGVQEIRAEPSDYWQLVSSRDPTKKPSLNDLVFTRTPEVVPHDNDVVVSVRAASINFKDIMLALGMLDGLQDDDEGVHLGLECSGVVVKTGARVTTLHVDDEVIGFGQHCFASHTTAHAELLVSKPKELSWTDCAGISVTFSTAYYSLVERANLQSGETVLIHSACGGVGLAAIQVARMIGCKIICSAGTEEKRQFLVEEMRVEMVTDSRSGKFYDDVMAWTEKRGVDVVLNSLHGELLVKGIELLAPGGRFCEIGKRDILENSHLQMNLWLENKSLLSCQIDRLMKLKPQKARDLLQKVVSLFEKGILRPTITTVCSIENYQVAFPTVAKGNQIGKIVFEIPSGFKPSAVEPSPVLFNESATYIITGGHGGLGLVLARWLCDKGARHIALVSRSGCESASAKRTVSHLRKNNTKVYNFAIDISEEVKVKKMFDDLRSEFQAPACYGIFHLAGVIADESLQSLNPDLMERFMGAKARGAHHLHTRSLQEPIDVFFMMSSSAALWSNSAQPGYVAANRYLDALAEERRAMGLPALSLQMGSVTGAGYLERNSATLRALEKKGQLHLNIDEILRCLTHLMQRKWLPPVVCLTNQDWDLNLKFCYPNSLKFRHLTIGDRAMSRQTTKMTTSSEDKERQIRRKMGEILSMNPQDINLKKPMVNYGVDSMMAVEMVSWASNELGLAITQMEVFSGITAEGVLERAT
ncbi:highly reducing polyketide synthase easB-like [Asterias rubens]|uniref:highly reducing polyketide synthase easB-like n=1 Tax=Asterias rubens TaxID=7604 RepID=UPI001455D3E6|nr:highly reducing polyketide synthase easB-like [Asterias rubens]